MCILIIRNLIYICWLLKKTDHNVTLSNATAALSRVQCSCGHDMQPELAYLQRNIPEVADHVVQWRELQMSSVCGRMRRCVHCIV